MEERFEDMGAVKRLRIIRDGDGDILVSISAGRMPLGGPDPDTEASVEFCIKGGHSPRTLRALVAVMTAMEEDEADRPSPPRR